MVRLPPGFHKQAVRGGNKLAWRPGWHGTGAQPIRATPIERYRRRIASVPLTGGQGQAAVSGGAATVTVGPQGLGTTWYPVSATISTTTGVFDGSTCRIYLGAQGVPIALQGTLFPGGAGTLSLAIPAMTPGQYLIAVWSGAHNGDLASINIVGLMDALAQ